jgi:hypothetical protein
MTDNRAADEPKPPVIIKLHPNPDEYHEAEVKFFYSLGTCVSRWAFVDRQLFRLFLFALKTDALRSAILYYKQKTLHQRIQYVDDLLEHTTAKEDFEKIWRPLRNRLFNDLLPTRNIFVHHPPARTGTSDGTKAIYNYSIHIEPNERILNRKYPGLKGKRELELQDLEQHAEAVETLERELSALVRSLVKRSQGDK